MQNYCVNCAEPVAVARWRIGYHTCLSCGENLDNSLYTSEQASLFFNLKADNLQHAHLLAGRLRDVFKADDYSLD